MADRARRAREEKAAAFANLKLARAGGKRNLKEEDVEIYDEVTEDQYKGIVRGRLQRDEFVVDDGVDGYMDNGMDDWGDNDEEEESGDEIRRKKVKKGKGDEKPKGKGKTKAKIPPPAPTASISAYRPVVSAEQEDDFMSAILGNMDAIPVAAPAPLTSKSRKRKPSPTFNTAAPSYSSYRRSQYDDASSDAPIEDDLAGPSSDDQFMSPKKKPRINEAYVNPAADRLAQLDVQSGPEDEFDTAFDDLDMDAFMDVDDLDVKPPPSKIDLRPANGSAKSAPVKKEDPDLPPSWLNEYDSLTVSSNPDSLGPLVSVKPLKGSAGATRVSALEPDGSLRFFWLDYLEHEGYVYFIGKLKDKASGNWVSCCVTVENIQRNLFVLPRPKRVEQDEDGELCETDIVPEMTDVRQDFEMIRKQVGIKTWKAKFVKRSYAFGEREVPRQETRWMKVVYGFKEPQVPMQACSPTIARIFGTNTSAFELLVLKRRIMGPCWLNIKNPQIDSKGISWCKLEVTVSDPKDINPFPDTDDDAPKEIPPLTIMSLSARTIVNHKENNREVVCATARIWHNLNIDDPAPPETLPCTVQTFVRPLGHFPPNFEVRAKANGKGFISPVDGERKLLDSLLAAIHQADPDIMVGHEFLGVSLDVLLHRMRDLKVDHWSRISRFRRSRWPNIGKQGTNLKFLNGRLLCDLSSDAAKGMISSTTWSLTEMCKTHLKSDRQDIDPDDTASYFDGSVSTPNKLLTFVRHCELDAHYQMAIASKVQILPLTKQLTALAGNSWNKTLNGGRAERNEYILLHEFHRLKYVCPDKSWAKKVIKEDDDQDGSKKTKGKRDKYKGGLVFEPKRGLWDKYILVMDFNSLYPSIIQEYNIDFTTVEPLEDEDEEKEEKIPDPPEKDVPQGVLPRLIATLVSRRKVVKNLMKDKGVSPAKLLQYDIKQQALKLTANSMYGCLGFEYSRFFARPLAALTTFKGREILTQTRELAESLDLDVVYGDTDSVFVNSNVTELSEALKISADFKKAVNNKYNLLEIDLDGVFQRLLLLQKKKYAALKVEDGTRTSTEVKGLDMKRREYCALSKNVSQYVLEQILSGEPTEIVVENIHEYLTTVNENVRSGKTSLEEFIIYKRLGKSPKDYPDAKSQPHVQVALRLQAKGGNARAGDVIPYVFCLAKGEESAKTGQADRAKHPDEVRRAGADLTIDFDFYLSHQVLPPIERLCEPIEGTDRARLAECLGLDPQRFRNVVAGGTETAFLSLDSKMSDVERFKDCAPFLVRCRKCEGELPFEPITKDSTILQADGPRCPACRTAMKDTSLRTQLEVQIRGYISKYYEGWTVCDDPTCNNRTRMMRVYGRRCLRPGCPGSVTFEYSDADLYNQLRFFSFLFDGEKAVNAKGPNQGKVKALADHNILFLDTMKLCADRYVQKCGRGWVEFSTLFSFMKV